MPAWVAAVRWLGRGKTTRSYRPQLPTVYMCTLSVMHAPLNSMF